MICFHLSFSRHRNCAITITFSQAPQGLGNDACGEFVAARCVRITTCDRAESGTLSTGLAVIYDETREGRCEPVRIITILWKTAIALTFDPTLSPGFAISSGSTAGV
jgi:hypothetical protein